MTGKRSNARNSKVQQEIRVTLKYDSHSRTQAPSNFILYNLSLREVKFFSSVGLSSIKCRPCYANVGLSLFFSLEMSITAARIPRLRDSAKILGVGCNIRRDV